MFPCKANNFEGANTKGGIFMPEQEEEKQKEQQPNSEEVAAAAIEKLKAENEKLMSENKDLKQAKVAYYDKIINGADPSSKEKNLRSAKEIRDDLWGKGKKDRTNLDNAILYNELDDACIREEGKSAYLPPVNEKGSYTQDDIDLAKKTHKAFEELIEEANGNPDVFDSEFMRRYPKPKEYVRKK